MSIPPAWPQRLDFFGTPLVLEPSPGRLSGDAANVHAARGADFDLDYLVTPPVVPFRSPGAGGDVQAGGEMERGGSPFPLAQVGERPVSSWRRLPGSRS
jgi:hypothetical protein